MQTFIALLRGINVGGRNLVNMADLRSRLAASGLKSVRSYIQSGNLVFEHPGAPAESLAQHIADTIETHFGFRPAVRVLTVTQLRSAVANNPLTT